MRDPVAQMSIFSGFLACEFVCRVRNNIRCAFPKQLSTQCPSVRNIRIHNGDMGYCEYDNADGWDNTSTCRLTRYAN
jgi:hypothetical protein